MNSTMTIGLMVALGAGLAIGLQGVFTSVTGQMLGPLRGGVAIHVGGALVGALMVYIVTLTGTSQPEIQLTPRAIMFSLIAGTVGMFIVMGIAFSFPRIGQVSGQVAIIMAQMTVGVIVDMYALAGGQPIPLDGRRILGLLVMAVGVYLLLPRQTVDIV